MKNLTSIFLTLTSLIIISNASAQMPNSWAVKNDFNGDGKWSAFSFSINGKGYMGTGATGAEAATAQKDFWEYNPLSDTWSQKADFAGGNRFQAVGFSIADKGYAGTGMDNKGNVKADFWQYDPLSNKWSKKADLPYHVYAAVGFNILSKGYIGTGLDIALNSKKDFYEYEPATNAWTKKADFKGDGRYGATGFNIYTKGYIGTGFTSKNTVVKDFWQYDPTENNWIRKADFAGVSRSNAIGLSIGNRGYLGTGNESKLLVAALSDFWEFNPELNIWVQKANFTAPKAFANAFVINGKAFVSLGLKDSKFIGSQTVSEFIPGNTANTSIPTENNIFSKIKAEKF